MGKKKRVSQNKQNVLPSDKKALPPDGLKGPNGTSVTAHKPVNGIPAKAQPQTTGGANAGNALLEIKAPNANMPKKYFSLKLGSGCCMLCDQVLHENIYCTSPLMWFDHVEGRKHDLSLTILQKMTPLAAVKNTYPIFCIPLRYLSQSEITCLLRNIMEHYKKLLPVGMEKLAQEKYLAFILRSGDEMHLQCKVCSFQGGHVAHWINHVLGCKHAMKCLTKIRSHGPNIYVRDFGKYPGPNPAVYHPSGDCPPIPTCLQAGIQGSVVPDICAAGKDPDYIQESVTTEGKSKKTQSVKKKDNHTISRQLVKVSCEKDQPTQKEQDSVKANSVTTVMVQESKLDKNVTSEAELPVKKKKKKKKKFVPGKTDVKTSEETQLKQQEKDCASEMKQPKKKSVSKIRRMIKRRHRASEKLVIVSGETKRAVTVGETTITLNSMATQMTQSILRGTTCTSVIEHHANKTLLKMRCVSVRLNKLQENELPGAKSDSVCTEVTEVAQSVKQESSVPNQTQPHPTTQIHKSRELNGPVTPAGQTPVSTPVASAQKSSLLEKDGVSMSIKRTHQGAVKQDLVTERKSLVTLKRQQIGSVQSSVQSSVLKTDASVCVTKRNEQTVQMGGAEEINESVIKTERATCFKESGKAVIKTEQAGSCKEPKKLTLETKWAEGIAQLTVETAPTNFDEKCKLIKQTVKTRRPQESSKPSVQSEQERTLKNVEPVVSLTPVIISKDLSKASVLPMQSSAGMSEPIITAPLKTATAKCHSSVPKNVAVVKPICQANLVSTPSSLAEVSSTAPSHASLSTTVSQSASSQAMQSCTDLSRSVTRSAVEQKESAGRPSPVLEGDTSVRWSDAQNRVILHSENSSTASDKEAVRSVQERVALTMPSKLTPVADKPDDSSVLLLQLKERKEVLSSVQKEIKQLKSVLMENIQDGMNERDSVTNKITTGHSICSKDLTARNVKVESAMLPDAPKKSMSLRAVSEDLEPQQTSRTVKLSSSSSSGKWTYENWKKSSNMDVGSSLKEFNFEEASGDAASGSLSRDGVFEDVEKKEGCVSSYQEDDELHISVNRRNSENEKIPHTKIRSENEDLDHIYVEYVDEIKLDCQGAYGDDIAQDRTMLKGVDFNENNYNKSCKLRENVKPKKYKRKRDHSEEFGRKILSEDYSQKVKKRKKCKSEKDLKCSRMLENSKLERDIQPLEVSSKHEGQKRLKELAKCLGMIDASEISSLMADGDVMDPRSLLSFLNLDFLNGVHQLCQLLDKGADPLKLTTLLDPVVLQDEGMCQLLRILVLSDDDVDDDDNDDDGNDDDVW